MNSSTLLTSLCIVATSSMDDAAAVLLCPKDTIYRSSDCALEAKSVETAAAVQATANALCCIVRCCCC